MSMTFMNRTRQVAEPWRPQSRNELTSEGDYHLSLAKTGVRVEAAKRRIIFAAVIVLASLTFSLQPATASETPWCAVISDGYWDCQYNSIEECRPNVLAGNRGFCNLNPRWTGWNGSVERRRLRLTPTYF
jgi:hypothetical protein